MEDLESKNSEDKNESDKELDDLLCEEDNEFKQKKEEEIIRKKTTMITEDLKASLMQDLDIKKSVVNVKDSNLVAQTNNDKTKPTTESKIVQSKVESKNKNIYVITFLEFFHSADRMKSIGVLQEELTLMDYIIKFNTKNNLDTDEFENKQFFIKNQIDVTILYVKLENKSFSRIWWNGLK